MLEVTIRVRTIKFLTYKKEQKSNIIEAGS